MDRTVLPGAVVLAIVLVNWPITYYVEPGRYPDGSERTGTGSDRHTLALKIDPADPRLPGQEVAANPIFVYCYLQPVEG